MPPVVLALGFDLFFRPKLQEAAKAAGVDVRAVGNAQALEAAKDAARVVADVSSPGTLDAVLALRQARPDLPVLACYPHVQADLAAAVQAAGGAVVTRGKFNADLAAALSGRL